MFAISTLKINGCRLNFEKQIKFIEKCTNKQHRQRQQQQPIRTSLNSEQLPRHWNFDAKNLATRNKQVLISWFDFDILPDAYAFTWITHGVINGPLITTNREKIMDSRMSFRLFTISMHSRTIISLNFPLSLSLYAIYLYVLCHHLKNEFCFCLFNLMFPENRIGFTIANETEKRQSRPGLIVYC